MQKIAKTTHPQSNTAMCRKDSWSSLVSPHPDQPSHVGRHINLRAQICRTGLLITVASTGAAAEVCDKGDLFENPLLGKAFALAVLLGPLLLLSFRRAWTDVMAGVVALLLMLGFCAAVIESFVPAHDSDPFVAAMKHEGCLWEPGWLHRTVLALIVVAYAAIIHVARKRVMRPCASASTAAA